MLINSFLFMLPQVSTKSGLDPSGVWQAWGMASLLAGNLTGAREKLARCLKPPVDRNQLNLGPPLLQEVVQHLETHSPPTAAPVGRNIAAAGVQELHNLKYSYSIHAIFFSFLFLFFCCCLFSMV